ncbi:unnamed protein product [Musa acuminata subsp. burmannicoides]|uniref:Uncharacterized protein n=1 Tax=Musa acuminata subsp. malaccensis TaxID=214687 RepID=A0A804U5S9_MUSAM|nr:unnamed protein product [Musa acuminata subsp. malaccensis]
MINITWPSSRGKISFFLAFKWGLPCTNADSQCSLNRARRSHITRLSNPGHFVKALDPLPPTLLVIGLA